MLRKYHGTEIKEAPVAGLSTSKRVAKPVRPEKRALEELSFYIGRAYYNYKALLERTLVETGLDAHLSPGMGHILFALFERDDCIIKDISERVQLSSATMTGMLRRMQRAGVIETRRDENDGRAVRVRLTERGRSLEGRCRGVVDRLNEVLQANMSDGDVRRSKRMLAGMIESMRNDEHKKREEKQP